MVETLVAIQAFLCLLPWFFVLRKRLHPLSAPVFVGLLFSHPYVLQPIRCLLGGVRLITWEMLEFGLIVSILCLVSLYLGWLWSKRRMKGSRARTYPLDCRRLMAGAVGFAGIAIIGWFAFAGASGGVQQIYSGAHGQGADWLGVTGYVYNLQHFLPPAVCMLLIVAYFARGKPIGTRAWRLAIVLSLTWLVHAVLWGSRGRFFQIAASWLVFLFAQRRPTRADLVKALVILSVVALVFQFLVIFRDYIHLGEGSWASALQSRENWRQVLTYNTFVPQPEYKSNTEIDYHSAVTYLFWKRGEYNWGASLVNPIINFLPRYLFPDKQSYKIRAVLDNDVLFGGVGWIPATGSCPTGPGRIFTEFGFCSLLFWFFIGAFVGRLDITSTPRPDPRLLAYHAAAFCGMLHLVLQSYGAGFLAFIFFAGPLWVTFRWARRSAVMPPAGGLSGGFLLVRKRVPSFAGLRSAVGSGHVR